MIGDDALLLLCRSAEAGTAGAEAVAWAAYGRAVVEWRERDRAWRRARVERAVGDRVADVAEVVWMSVVVARVTRPI